MASVGSVTPPTRASPPQPAGAVAGRVASTTPPRSAPAGAAIAAPSACHAQTYRERAAEHASVALHARPLHVCAVQRAETALLAAAGTAERGTATRASMVVKVGQPRRDAEPPEASLGDSTRTPYPGSAGCEGQRWSMPRAAESTRPPRANSSPGSWGQATRRPHHRWRVWERSHSPAGADHARGSPTRAGLAKAPAMVVA